MLQSNYPERDKTFPDLDSAAGRFVGGENTMQNADNHTHDVSNSQNDRCIEGILFDLDNTLIATEDVAVRALEIILRQFEVKLGSEEKDWMVGRCWDDIFDRLLIPRNLPITRDELAHLVILQKDMLLEQMCDEGKLPVLPGAIEALQSLHPHYPLGIVSGSYRDEIMSVLELMDISQLFQCIVGSEDVDHGKPHPGPYLKAAGLLNFQPRHILVFEDSSPGVASAIDAGCNCIAVLAGRSPANQLQAAHLIIPTLECVNPTFVESFQNRP